jgi:hypothetical protein
LKFQPAWWLYLLRSYALPVYALRHTLYRFGSRTQYLVFQTNLPMNFRSRRFYRAYTGCSQLTFKTTNFSDYFRLSCDFIEQINSPVCGLDLRVEFAVRFA